MTDAPTAFDEGAAAVAAAVPEPAPQPQPQLPAKAEPSAVARPQAAGRLDDFDGELLKGDLKIPRLNLVQNIGPLSDDFPKGAWVLNRKIQLAGPGDAINITVLRARKYYAESTEYGSDEIGRVFDKLEEAKAAGLRTEFGNDGTKPEIQQCLDVTCLIRGEDGQTAPEFAFEFEGTRYALALWGITSWTAYENAARPLLTARAMYLPSFNAREWGLRAEKHTMKNGNTTQKPVLEAGLNHKAEFIAWSGTLL